MVSIVRPKPPMTVSSVPLSTAPTAIKPPARRPAPPAHPAAALVALPKEEPKYEAPPRPKPKAEESRPAPKPVVSAGEPADSGQPTEDTGRADELEEAAGQITRVHLHAMNVLDRHVLWKRLNHVADSIRFVTILRPEELPKRMEREDPPSGKPAGRGIMWCCYCADWTVFVHFAYVGSDKCIGCGISTKDYYNRSANNLWKADV